MFGNKNLSPVVEVLITSTFQLQVEKSICKSDPKTEQITLDWHDQKVEQVSAETEVTSVAHLRQLLVLITSLNH